MRDHLAGAVDGVRLGGRQLAEAAIGARGRLFDQRQSPNEFGEMPDRNARDGKIRHGAQRVHAPIGVGGNIRLAQHIVLAPRRDIGERN